MRIDDLPASEFTDAQWTAITDRIDEFSARCEAAAWIVYQDDRYIGGFEGEKRNIIFKSAMKAMGLPIRSRGGARREAIRPRPSRSGGRPCLASRVGAVS